MVKYLDNFQEDNGPAAPLQWQFDKEVVPRMLVETGEPRGNPCGHGENMKFPMQ